MFLRYLFPLLLLAFPSWVSATDVSILDFKRKPNALKKVSKEEAEFLTDGVRKVAVQQSGWRILSRENIQKILEENGKEYAECMASAEGKCEVAIGQILQANYHVVGDISMVGAKFAISLRLYDVKESRLVSSEALRATTVDAAVDQIDGLAGKLFAPVVNGLSDSGAVANIAVSRFADTTGNKLVPAVASAPGDAGKSLLAKTGVLMLQAQEEATGQAMQAQILLDGAVVGKTPQSIILPLDGASVVLRATGYGDVTVTEHPRTVGGTATAMVMMKKKLGEGMVRIPAGCFQMGSTRGERDEKPVHEVCLDSFSLDATEVTNAAYERSGKRGHFDDGTCYSNMSGKWEVAVAPDRFRGGKQPVICVDWFEAMAYCESQGKRLPTEAEFEYSTRAGTTTTYFWGNDADEGCRYANGADRTPLSTGGNWGGKTSECRDGYSDVTAPVGSFQANVWGLSDMTGNVSEFVVDWFGNKYYGESPRQNPSGPSSQTPGFGRVFRGGAWNNVSSLRSSARGLFGASPSFRGNNLGFRCAGP